MTRLRSEDSTVLKDYRVLMNEAKVRLLSVPVAIDSARHGALHGFLAGEFAYLQFRMICELIALSCLLAHDDIEITRTGKMQRLDEPKDIIKQLEALYSKFYPRPVQFQDWDRKPLGPDGPSGYAKFRASPLYNTPYLTKTDLLDLYGVCGNFLHRGSLKQFSAGTTVISFENIQQWAQKISALLQNHEIRLIDEGVCLWCALGPPDGGVFVAVGRREPESPRQAE